MNEINKNRWINPDPNTSGILLSDRIKFYVEKTGMIKDGDFNEDNLRPANYDLTIGDEYYINDKKFELKDGKSFIIAKNTLAFIKIKEELNLPSYIVAKYNLRTKQTLRGFLMGTGLQVDPGFSGYLYVPIFNFTNDERKMKKGENLISMEFHITSPLGENHDLKEFKTFTELESTKKGIKGKDGNICKIFQNSDRDFTEYEDPRDRNRKSAVENLQDQIEEIQKFKTRSTLSIIGVVLTFIAIVVAIFINWEIVHRDLTREIQRAILNVERDSSKNLIKNVKELKGAMEKGKEFEKNQEKAIGELTKKLNKIEKDIKSIQKPSNP